MGVQEAPWSVYRLPAIGHVRLKDDDSLALLFRD